MPRPRPKQTLITKLTRSRPEQPKAKATRLIENLHERLAAHLAIGDSPTTRTIPCDELATWSITLSQLEAIVRKDLRSQSR